MLNIEKTIKRIQRVWPEFRLNTDKYPTHEEQRFALEQACEGVGLNPVFGE